MWLICTKVGRESTFCTAVYDIYKNLLYKAGGNGKICYECEEICDTGNQNQPWHIFAEVMEPDERNDWIHWNYKGRMALDSNSDEINVNKRALALSWLCPRCFISLKDVKTTLIDIEGKIGSLKQQIVDHKECGSRLRTSLISLARSLTYRSIISTVVTQKTSMRWTRAMAILRTFHLQLGRQYALSLCRWPSSVSKSREHRKSWILSQAAST